MLRRKMKEQVWVFPLLLQYCFPLTQNWGFKRLHLKGWWISTTYTHITYVNIHSSGFLKLITTWGPLRHYWRELKKYFLNEWNVKKNYMHFCHFIWGFTTAYYRSYWPHEVISIYVEKLFPLHNASLQGDDLKLGSSIIFQNVSHCHTKLFDFVVGNILSPFHLWIL